MINSQQYSLGLLYCALCKYTALYPANPILIIKAHLDVDEGTQG